MCYVLCVRVCVCVCAKLLETAACAAAIQFFLLYIAVMPKHGSFDDCCEKT